MNNYEAVTNSLKTIMEMLHDRKIELSANAADILTSGYSTRFNKMIFEIIIDDIKLIYYLSPKYKWSELKKNFEDTEENNKYSLHILITKDKISANNMKSINELKINIQIFDIKELQFNITKHVLVPKHELFINENEITELLEKYSLKSKFQLPIILKNDPVAKYFNIKNGDVVKVSRVSPSSGEYITYRCCL